MTVDPFDGRSEMTSEEYRSWLAEANQAVFVPLAPIATVPDWQTTEKAFMAKVVKYATDHGWLCYHTHKSANSAPGFPDLVFVRQKVLFAELKVGTAKPTADQRRWLEALESVDYDGVATFLWYPEDIQTIEEVLR